MVSQGRLSSAAVTCYSRETSVVGLEFPAPFKAPGRRAGPTRCECFVPRRDIDRRTRDMHAELINLHDFEARAKEALPDAVWNRGRGRRRGRDHAAKKPGGLREVDASPEGASRCGRTGPICDSPGENDQLSRDDRSGGNAENGSPQWRAGCRPGGRRGGDDHGSRHLLELHHRGGGRGGNRPPLVPALPLRHRAHPNADRARGVGGLLRAVRHRGSSRGNHCLRA